MTTDTPQSYLPNSHAGWPALSSSGKVKSVACLVKFHDVKGDPAMWLTTSAASQRRSTAPLITRTGVTGTITMHVQSEGLLFVIKYPKQGLMTSVDCESGLSRSPEMRNLRTSDGIVGKPGKIARILTKAAQCLGSYLLPSSRNSHRTEATLCCLLKLRHLFTRKSNFTECSMTRRNAEGKCDK